MKRETTKTVRVGCILLVLFLFFAFALLPQLVRAQTVTATITVGGESQGVAVTPNGKYVYVANWGSDTVSVISTATTPASTSTPTATSTPIPTASPSPTIPEFPDQLIGIALVISMIIVLSVVIIAKKRVAWKNQHA